MAATNYVLFSPAGKICRYQSEIDILKEFFNNRSDLYKLRKKYMLARIQRDLEVLENKVKFISEVNDGKLVLNKVKRQVILQTLVNRGYKKISQINKIMEAFAKLGPQPDKTKAAKDQEGEA